MILTSCKKDKHYFKFSSKELDFVSYSEGQNIKFIDTNFIIYSLIQKAFVRNFHEQIGITGKTGNFIENYETSYISEGSVLAFGFSVSLNAGARPSLYINFNSYGVYATPDSLSTINSIVISGVTYKNVYTIKAYKNDQFTNNNDTVTLYTNKEYGIIQLVFPNGKKIVRTK